MSNKKAIINVVGAGLAGCEASLQLSARGFYVRLFEMRPKLQTGAHKTDNFAELVCSNSLKSLNPASAAGCLKTELGILGSELLECAYEAQVAAGQALAVDREKFSATVKKRIENQHNIEVVRQEYSALNADAADYTIIASGPLTSDNLAQSVIEITGGNSAMSFYDAVAPIVDADSLNRDIIFEQSRYDKGDSSDYLNAPFDRDEYYAFIDALLNAERVIAKDFEQKDLFCACQPVEEVARSGRDALRFGALKPVGLVDIRTGMRPYACVQLRAENNNKTAYNLVGFQTNLTFGEQQRVFRMIPGLENADFLRYGVMHRNTFIDSPRVLTRQFCLPSDTRVHFAGQITGTEGYTEAIASGLFAALSVTAQVLGSKEPILPTTTVLGALFDYATDPNTKDYQPMHVNFGIIEPLPQRVKSKKERYAAYAARSEQEMKGFVLSYPELFAIPGGR
ncbi:MAG: methylenetetrahydrofolate--tRNA-(uracil(54)-C(5))-methyltransferase (FADH(2)-oxidizing) TrmFO [Coriobacteriales bacterium]|nr:methylenetetrahydrofolate--tRNA-(uracil(54)-C(5))-methyltransferase (FADH(2)-oxidizing) TrmFO [Coriobacteriales bacterium]